MSQFQNPDSFERTSYEKNFKKKTCDLQKRVVK
jgi:hypothetical protein